MKRTRLRPMSKKREAASKEYTAKRSLFLQQRPACERCQRRPSRDVHHVEGRYNGAYLDASTWKAVCRACHDWIHQHPSDARASGWLK
jgi:hypothetical protein